MARIGLRGALLTAFLFASAAPLIVFWLWPHNAALNNEVSAAREHHLVLARNAAAELERYHHDLVSTFATVAPEIAAGADARVAASLFTALAFGHVCVMNRETGVVTRSFLAVLNPCPAVAPPERLAMFRAMAAAAPVSVSPVQKLDGGAPRLFIVADQGESLVVGAVSTERFRALATSISFGAKGHAVIVDAMGRLLAHPDYEWALAARDMSDLPIVRRMMRGESGVDQFVSPAFGDAMIAGFATVEGPGWGVMVPEPLSALKAKASVVTASARLVFAAGVALSAVLALMFSAHLSRNLRQLSEAARRMARGEGGVRVAPGVIGGALAEIATLGRTFNVMAQRIEAAHARIVAIASADSLTGLLNRSGFFTAAAPLLAQARGDGAAYALFFIDVDRFKTVNDCHGHAVGDALLRALAARLRRTVGAGDLIARQGGDEFLVLHRKLSARACARLGARLLRALNDPVEIEGVLLEPSVSIGVATFPRDAGDVHALTLRADQALYQAKRSGRNFLRFFDANLRRRIDDDIALKRELRDAIEAGAVGAEFQPIVDARGGALTGFETLARWTSPSLGPIPPERFIAIAEETGLIVALGAHMRAQAFAFAAALRDAGAPRAVAVNVSQLELAQAGFAARVLSDLAAHRLAPEAIVLEITETVFQVHAARELEGLFALRQMGVRFALDDFGKGFSSHSHLRAYPVDRLKICADLLGDIETDAKARAVVRSLVQLGRSLDLAVTVEGVETAAQRDMAAMMGADDIQGFWHHPPMDADAALALATADVARAPKPRLAAV